MGHFLASPDTSCAQVTILAAFHELTLVCLDHLFQEILFNTFQKSPGLLMPSHVALPAHIMVT